MKIALAQLSYIPGDVKYNTRKIVSAIEYARSINADLVVTSEMSVTGYLPMDLLMRSDIINDSMAAVKEIASCCNGIAAIIGAPSPNTGVFGKYLHNSAFFMEEGKVRAVINKTLLPTYDVFDENRYFEPGTLTETIELKGNRIAITICEDIWDEQPCGDRGVCRLYGSAPLETLARENPSLIINIAANPFSHNRLKIREEIFIRNAVEYGIPLISVNQTGGYTDLIFDGSSVVIDSDGTVTERLPFCAEEVKVVEFPIRRNSHVEENLTGYPHDMIWYIHRALVTGIKDFFSKGGIKKAVVGLSGGIDSAVVLALASEALGPRNVTAILMPSSYSSDHSVSDAVRMAEGLGIEFRIIGIEEIRRSVDMTMEPLFSGKEPDITEENIQARIRALILMAYSNKFGSMVLNTSNKSEAATGYGTLYGDMIGGLSVIGDLYKTEVYRLAKHINSETTIIPDAIITKPPSAELKPGQLDTDSLPPYDILDPLLFRLIDMERSPMQLVSEGFDAVLVEKVAGLIRTSEFKRKQTPPVLRVSSKGFGSGRRIPVISNYR